MATQETYQCKNCDFEYTEEGTLFYYDSEKHTTETFLHLFSTVGIADDSEIKGYTHETYCNHCNKFVRTYYVTEYPGDDFHTIKDLILNGIERSLLCARKELCDMTEEEDPDDLDYYHEKYQRSKSLINRVVDAREEVNPNDDSYIIMCPNCLTEIQEYINEYFPCPKCGGEMISTQVIHMD